MKILMVEPHGLLPGPSMYAKEFCDALALDGHEVTLLTAQGLVTALDGGGGWQHIQAMPKDSTTVVDMKTPRFFLFKRFLTFWTNWKTISFAFCLHYRQKFDAVHFLSSEPLTLSILYVLSGLPSQVFATNRGYEFGLKGAPADFDTKIYQYLRRIFWKRLAQRVKVLVESPYVKDLLETDKLVVSKPVCVIPHPVWSSRVAAPCSKREARRLLEIEYEGPLFLVFGHRPKMQKALFTLVSAIQFLPKTFRILIAGHESDVESDQQLVKAIVDSRWEKDVYRHFRFIPNDQIGLYCAACEGMILSYRKNYIGSSGVLNLACEYELPVIASDVGDLGATVLNYNIGLCFETENAVSLQCALERFLKLSDDDLFKIKENMKRLQEERSWRNIVRAHVAVYRQEQKV